MNQKTTFLVLGLTLAIVAALAVAPIVNELAYAGAGTGGTGGKGATAAAGRGAAAIASKPGNGGSGDNK